MLTIGTVNKPLSVMIVDDDSFSSAHLSEVLRAQGVDEIHTASSGCEALDCLSTLTRAPNLLICDLFMPEMDGIEFMAALAKNRYQGSVILISGVDNYLMLTAQTLALADGIQLLGSYEKPLARDTLAELLHKHCRQSEVVRLINPC